jgi:hypothetical protein
VVVIEHLGGIGKTEIVLKEGQWPDRLRFILRHFKALEGFKVSTDSRQFEGAISTTRKGHIIRLRDRFTATRKGDFIYINAPRYFVKRNDRSLRIEWVDFYRR